MDVGAPAGARLPHWAPCSGRRRSELERRPCRRSRANVAAARRARARRAEHRSGLRRRPGGPRGRGRRAGVRDVMARGRWHVPRRRGVRSRRLRSQRGLTETRDEANDRGYIIPIGGAEEKIRDRDDPEALRRDLRRARTPTSRSSRPRRQLDETGSATRRSSRDLGARKAVSLAVREARRTAGGRTGSPSCARRPGVFLTGGNQLRLSTTLGGTVVAQIAARPQPRGAARRRHVGRSRLPVRAHDRLRRLRAPRRAPTW